MTAASTGPYDASLVPKPTSYFRRFADASRVRFSHLSIAAAIVLGGVVLDCTRFRDRPTFPNHLLAAVSAT